jgi:hypothetical protein
MGVAGRGAGDPTFAAWALRDEVTATRNVPQGLGGTAGGNSIRHARVIWDA